MGKEEGEQQVEMHSVSNREEWQQEKWEVQPREHFSKNGAGETSSSLRLAIKRSLKDTKQHKESMPVPLQDGESIEPNTMKKCGKCGKTICWGNRNSCVMCKAVYHARCSSSKFGGERWVCKPCRMETSKKLREIQEKIKETQEDI